jgi:hypothetical protein
MNLPRTTSLLAALLTTAGCRGAGDIDSMLGTFVGTLACSADAPDPDNDGETVSLDFTVEATLDLTDQDELIYQGSLATVTAYTWRGRAVREDAAYDVTLFQPRLQGGQLVEIQSSVCTAYTLYVDDVSAGGACEAADTGAEPTAPPPPSGDLRWDGADSIAISGSSCDGTLKR